MAVGEPIAVGGEITAVLTARKPKAKPEEASRKPRAANGRDRAEACGRGNAPIMNDDIPFASEWR
jgi:hypothetical protein